MSEINPQAILDYITETGAPATKRDLARAFNLKGEQRIALKAALKELMDSGRLEKTAAKAYALPNKDNIPAVAVFEVTEVTLDGEVYGRPVDNPDLEAQLGKPIPIDPKSSAEAPVEGDRVLAKLSHGYDGSLIAKMMRHLGQQRLKLIVGRAIEHKNGWIIEPVDKRDRDT